MKKGSFLLAFISTLFLWNCEITSVKAESANNVQPVKVSQADSHYFESVDGSAWIPVMINYLPPNFKNSEGRNNTEFTLIEDYFKQFSDNGGNAMRIWISTPFLEIEDNTEGQYNSLKFQRIDRLLELAKKYNIRILFTLHHIRQITSNNTNWDNNRSLATAFSSIEEYMNTPKGRDSYLRRAKAIADRYKDNQQIFGWELWNEVNAASCTNWGDFTTVVLDQIQLLFPNQLVTQSLGSLDSYSANDAYRQLFTYKSNAFVSVHRYAMDSDPALQYYSSIKGAIDTLVSGGINFARQYINDRPILMEEIGAVTANYGAPSKYYANDKQGVLIHDMIFAPFFCGAAGSGAMWHWDHYIYPNKLWYHFKRFNNAIQGIDPVKEQMKPFTATIDGVRCFGLKGNDKTIVWCRDAANNWRTELEDGIPALPKTNWSFETNQMISGNFSSVRFYDPWTDVWSDGVITNGTLSAPSFTRSIVIVLMKKHF